MIETDRLILRQWKDTDRPVFAELNADPETIEIKDSSEFIGFTGLAVPSYETHFTPCTEIGWRLHKSFWGNGYATEGAKSVLNFAFNELGKDEIVSFASNLNIPSINVMKRIGMTHDQEGDFDHPRVADGHELKSHVLYRIKANDIDRLRNSFKEKK